MKKVILFGSTGSIGCNVIRVIRQLKGFQIVGLATYRNYAKLMKQARDIKPRFIGLVDREHPEKRSTRSRTPHVLYGEEGLTAMIQRARADILICAFASSVGINSIITAIRQGMRICLATKEILVSYGDIVMAMVKKHNTELYPIDSEHSAIYQCMESKPKDDIARIILTASGGPFLHRSIKNVRKKDVLNHPVWNMGAKITVDSATMMNKGLEVIEAHHLFAFPADRIDVVVHPEALCHSLIQFADGTLLAQMSTPDMRLPIQYALTAPRRMKSAVKNLDISKTDRMTFSPPDLKKFPCLTLAYEALKIGGSMPAVLNATNDMAVHLFLEGRITFQEIPRIIKQVMKQHRPRKGDIAAYKRTEEWARNMVRQYVC